MESRTPSKSAAIKDDSSGDTTDIVSSTWGKIVPDQNHSDTVDTFLEKMHKVFYQVVSSDE